MTETRAPYGLPLRFRTVASYHMRWRGEVSLHSDNVLDIEAPDAIEASRAALIAIKKFTPPGATIFNVMVTAALIIQKETTYHDELP